MQSRASFKAHPIHPMLIVYPFAFSPGRSDSPCGRRVKNRILRDVAVISYRQDWPPAWLPQFPASIDYLTVIPPRVRAKNARGSTRYLNTTGLSLFAASWLLERTPPASALSCFCRDSAPR
jgi:hypothetical protein